MPVLNLNDYEKLMVDALPTHILVNYLLIVYCVKMKMFIRA